MVEEAVLLGWMVAEAVLAGWMVVEEVLAGRIGKERQGRWCHVVVGGTVVEMPRTVVAEDCKKWPCW